jgi:tight adherence protein C
VGVAIIQLLAFCAVMLFVLGLRQALAGEKVDAPGEKPALFRMFPREIQTVGRFIAPALSRTAPEQTLDIRRNLVAAALPLEVAEVRGLQGLGMAVAGVIGGVGVFLMTMNGLYALFGLLFFVFLGWSYPVMWVGGCARRRKDDMSRALPFAIDLVTVAMQAGQDFGAAVRLLVREGLRGPLATEFGVALRETELGKSRVEALKNMADRIQLDEFRSLVTAVVQSSEMGASIAATMKVQAEEIRRARFHKAERQAARAPSLMLIPLALFILPAVFVIIFTPVIIRVQDSAMAGYFGG